MSYSQCCCVFFAWLLAQCSSKSFSPEVNNNPPHFTYNISCTCISAVVKSNVYKFEGKRRAAKKGRISSVVCWQNKRTSYHPDLQRWGASMSIKRGLHLDTPQRGFFPRIFARAGTICERNCWYVKWAWGMHACAKGYSVSLQGHIHVWYQEGRGIS